MPLSFPRPRVIDIIAWVLLAAAMIFAIYVRVRLREFPLERDEGEFAYAGQLLLQGVPPYKLAYNMKLPGTYMAYAALMAVFHQTTAGVHLGLLAVNLATIWLLYRLVREMFDPLSAGLAAVFYSTLSISPGVLGMAAHATHFVAFFGVAGVYLLWRYLQSGRWRSLLGSGFLLGTAFLMKQQGVFLMVFGGAVVTVYAVIALVKAFRAPEGGPRSKLLPILQAAAFYVAEVLPYLLICLWLWRAGVFDKFWFWTVTYAREYVQQNREISVWQSFWDGEGGPVVARDWIGWSLALAGCVAVMIRGWFKPVRSLFVLGFFVFSFLCVCPGFFFRAHYFIVALPAVAMLAGIACGDFLWLANLWKLSLVAAPAAPQVTTERRKKAPPAQAAPAQAAPAPARRNARFAPLVLPAALVVLLAIIWPIVAQKDARGFYASDYYFSMKPTDACRRIYMGNPFLECPQLAEVLKSQTAPDDTIAVLGSEPEVFFDAQRRSATGYIYTYGLMEEQPLAPRMQQEMIDEIEAKKPKYIVFANARFSWLVHPKAPTKIFEWAMRYLPVNYDIVGLLEPKTEMETESFWGEQMRNYRVNGNAKDWKVPFFPDRPYIIVLHRKSTATS
jgi:hypothetical protein